MSTPPGTTAGTEPPNQLLASISRKLDSLEHDVRGNGDMGLKQRTSRIEAHLFHNPKTGDVGMVRTVKELSELVNGVRAQMKLLNWLLGIFGTGGVLIFLRSIFGPVG